MAQTETGNPANRTGVLDRIEGLLGSRSLLEGVAVFILFVYAARIGIELANRPLGISNNFFSDFIAFWSGSHFALQGDFVTPYDFDAFVDFQKELFGKTGLGFFNPPTWYLYIFPFALVPYPVAAIAFQVLGLTLLSFVCALLAKRRQAGWMALVFPGVLFCVLYGQNGILNAVLIGGAIAGLERGRPLLAGVLIGLLAYKPHMGLLIPFALLAGREYRAFISAALISVGIALLSVLLFGLEPWIAFLASMDFVKTCLLEACVPMQKYASPYGFLRQLGVDAQIAMGVQLVAAGGVLLSVVWTWSRPVPMALKGALLVAGAGVASPYFLDYDTALLVVPLVLIARLGVDGGFLRYERVSLFALTAAMFISRGYGVVVPVSLIALAPAGYFLIALRRVFATGNASVSRLPQSLTA
ncbi:glycosyltransferase family 87 protein [uncultured Roseibium sp.]|uniref:glycosyltransferase family 87 protein n=1 Tax=uncultured Roseibium sp. TaxID=1936171 RepID=UPI003216EB61